MEEPILTNKEVRELVAFNTRLQTSMASMLNTIEQLEKELYFVIRKNMQLENQEDSVTLALLKNPLLNRKEFRV